MENLGGVDKKDPSPWGTVRDSILCLRLWRAEPLLLPDLLESDLIGYGQV